jgi:hypothetical protein
MVTCLLAAPEEPQLLESEGIVVSFTAASAVLQPTGGNQRPVGATVSSAGISDKVSRYLIGVGIL